jgi:anti-sigma-K factor RskA
MTDHHDCNGDAAAYVLGALGPEEAESFRRHLETCVVCRDEVVAFQQVTDALPMAVPQYPASRSLRRRVLREVRADASAKRSRWHWPSFSLPRIPALAGALAALIIALVIGIEAGSSSSGGTRVIAASVGSADVRVSGSHAELLVHHLPPPPPGHIYEMWIQRGNASPTPTRTLFSVTRTGASAVGVPGSVRGVSRLMVTAEPNGGSLLPTSMPVIVARLS